MSESVHVTTDVPSNVDHPELVPVKNSRLKKVVKTTLIATAVAGAGVVALTLKGRKSSHENASEVVDNPDVIGTVETA